jgi:hypothetical protein
MGRLLYHCITYFLPESGPGNICLFAILTIVVKNNNKKIWRYLLKGLVFTTPFLFYFIIVLVVDPYNFLNICHIISDNDKIAVINRTDESSPRGNILWKAIEVDRNPVDKIIIGDSQGKYFKPELIKSVNGETFYNFCVPGASFETMFDIFWFTAEKQNLKKVYFQVAFMNYNARRSYCLFHFAKDYLERPYLYFVRREIFFDTFDNILYHLSQNPQLVQRSYEYLPDNEINELAISRLNLFFGHYEYPDKHYQELLKISQYCESKNIELRFIILPSYVAVNDFIQENGLAEMEEKFKKDIKSLGQTFDFDIPGEIKNTREYFYDYFHLRQPILDSLTIKIWEDDKFLNGRMLNPKI